MKPTSFRLQLNLSLNHVKREGLQSNYIQDTSEMTPSNVSEHTTTWAGQIYEPYINLSHFLSVPRSLQGKYKKHKWQRTGNWHHFQLTPKILASVVEQGLYQMSDYFELIQQHFQKLQGAFKKWHSWLHNRLRSICLSLSTKVEKEILLIDCQVFLLWQL